MGLQRMDMAKRPKQLSKRQALAAVGQCRLMALWDKLFELKRQPVAQILLTRNDLADRKQYQNAQATFSELLSMGVIPIVNENDTIAVSEIKFGDNDTLSAITAAMLQADYLFLMTDVDCLYDKNPRLHPDAQAIEEVSEISKLAADVSSAGSNLGTGGMGTKIVAARLATSAGVTTIITKSSKPGNVAQIVAYMESRRETTGTAWEDSNPSGSTLASESTQSTSPSQCPLHTCFLPDPEPIRDRSFWLLHSLAPRGKIFIDQGAHRALANKAGLLPVGVVGVEGSFSQHEAVMIFASVKGSPRASQNADVQGNKVPLDSPNPLVTSEPSPRPPSPLEIGRALVNYSSAEILRIKGLQSVEIESKLGYADSEYVAQRENIRLFKMDRDAESSLNNPIKEEMAMRTAKIEKAEGGG